MEAIDLDTNEHVSIGDARTSTAAIRWLVRHRPNSLSNLKLVGFSLEDCILQCSSIKNLMFESCLLNNLRILFTEPDSNIQIVNCQLVKCDDLYHTLGVHILGSKTWSGYDNDAIAKEVGGRVYSLPNKDFVKVEVECDFCHNKFYDIMSRKNPRKLLKAVPQSDRRVCDQCYKNYELSSKIKGNRTYGYRGALNFYRTPMDAKTTEILGLEMEFEGDFWDWKGLQDAHRGFLHYGYDSSVRGENELSWDCGSYSYWKYLSPLGDVCKAVANGGGSPGDSAGIHIHVSHPDGPDAVRTITHTINMMCRAGSFRTLLEAVSLRSNKERFERYANLSVNDDEHHAGVSFNGHGTCEFRVFNSSLDPRLILRHLKFCKEFYHLVREKTPKDKILELFSKETKRHIASCANTQAGRGFITPSQASILIKKLGVF